MYSLRGCLSDLSVSSWFDSSLDEMRDPKKQKRNNTHISAETRCSWRQLSVYPVSTCGNDTDVYVADTGTDEGGTNNVAPTLSEVAGMEVVDLGPNWGNRFCKKPQNQISALPMLTQGNHWLPWHRYYYRQTPYHLLSVCRNIKCMIISFEASLLSFYDIWIQFFTTSKVASLPRSTSMFSHSSSVQNSSRSVVLVNPICAPLW